MRGEIRALAACAGEEAAMAEARIGSVVEMKQTAMRQPIRTCFDNGWALVEGQIGVLVARDSCSCSECGRAGIWHKILVVDEVVWSRRRGFKILLLPGGEHG
jgi:hypothetical protein